MGIYVYFNNHNFKINYTKGVVMLYLDHDKQGLGKDNRCILKNIIRAYTLRKKIGYWIL